MFAQWMDHTLSLGLDWVTLLGLATWRALPLLLLVVMLQAVLRITRMPVVASRLTLGFGWLSPAVLAMLWTIVLVRFLLPFSVGSTFSLHRYVDAWTSKAAEPSPQSNVVMQDGLQFHFFPDAPKAEPPAWDLQLAKSQSTANQDVAMEDAIVVSLLAIVMLTSIVLLLRGVVAHVRFALALRRCPLLSEQALIDMLLRECDAMGVGRRPAVREVPGLSVPAVFGLMRKTICIPTGMVDTFSPDELRWVVRHELAHIRRYDIPVAVIASMASACHWFNPLIWLTNSRLRLAMETAADRLAVASLTQPERVGYGRLLLRLAEGNSTVRGPATLGLLPMAAGNHLKQRVQLLIHDSPPRGLVVNTVSVCAIVVLATAGLSDARNNEMLKEPEIHLPQNNTFAVAVDRYELEPWKFVKDDPTAFAKSYDIGPLQSKIPNELAESERDGKTQLLRWLPLPSEIAQYLDVEEHTLVARLNAAQHELLARILKAWQSGEPRQVVIDTRIVQTNRQIASEIDWASNRIASLTVQGIGPAIAARISEEQLKRLIQSAQTEARTNVLFAPRITCFDGQTASITDFVQRPFVTGIDPKSNGQVEAVISVIDEGLKLVLTPQIGQDSDVNLSFDVKATNVSKVSYANLPIRIADKPPYTVQVPATERYSINSTVDLAAGESVVVAIPRVFNLEPGADADSTVLVTLTPRVIEASETK